MEMDAPPARSDVLDNTDPKCHGAKHRALREVWSRQEDLVVDQIYQPGPKRRSPAECDTATVPMMRGMCDCALRDAGLLK